MRQQVAPVKDLKVEALQSLFLIVHILQLLQILFFVIIYLSIIIKIPEISSSSLGLELVFDLHLEKISFIL